MRRPTPTITSQPFWDAAAAGRLAFPRCPACSTWHGYPRPWCTRCLHQPLELAPVSGQGTVYSATVVHRPAQPSFAALVPYTYALVDLDEGIRVITMVTGCPPEAVTAGTRVEATIDLPGDEDQPAAPLIFFTPSGAEPIGDQNGVVSA
jgi:uncharacterized OB-fold protein